MTVFEYLFIAHILGDWIFQNEWMAVNKTKIILAMVTHIFVYHFFIYSVLGFHFGFTNPKVIIALCILMIFHAILDLKWTVENFIKFLRINVHREPNQMIQLAIDQSLHLILLALTVIYFHYYG